MVNGKVCPVSEVSFMSELSFIMATVENLKDTKELCEKLETQYSDIETLIEMGYEEEDEDLAGEIRTAPSCWNFFSVSVSLHEFHVALRWAGIEGKHSPSPL